MAPEVAGAAYLFVRGMTGPGVGRDGPHPHGVFTWEFAPALAEASDAPRRRTDRSGAMTVVAGRPTGWSTEAADAVLATWVGAGVLGDVELHLVSAVLRLAPDRPDDAVLLALALAARATRLGHVCLDLDRGP